MARSKESFNKREKEKQRQKEKRQKREKMEERRANQVKGKPFDEMLAYIDENGNEVPGNASNFMPWFNRVSTIVRSTRGTQEYPQKNVTLPGYIGANAAFILNPAVSLIDRSGEVIDYNKLQSGNNLIGWMYGGIEATAPQSNGFNPTSASSTIYEVWLQKN